MAAASCAVWDSVLELTKSAQVKNCDPQLWAIQLSSNLNSAGVDVPSVELAHLLVSHICFDNHMPITWKFLEKALSFNLVPPLLVLALLSKRVVPNRQLHPSAYRLYMELVKRHAFSFSALIAAPNYQLIMKSIGDVAHLSQIFGVQLCEPGFLLVEFVFSIVWQLLDASLDDEGLLELGAEKNSRWLPRPEGMEIDGHENFSEKRNEHHEGLHKVNTTMAIELIGEFLKNKLTSRLLYLARQNMPSHWRGFIEQLQLLVVHSAALRNSKHITPDAFLQLTSDTRRVLSCECKTISQHEFHAVMFSGSLKSSVGQCHGASQSAVWLPIDLFLEDTMDGSQVTTTSAIENLISLVKALQAVNRTTWHDTFLGLWIAALRLVQRERNPSEGPVPRLDTCLSMLLSITTLVVANIIEEEESELIDETQQSPTNQRKEKQGKCRKGLITSLQLLGDYEGLLTPPQPVSSVANQAAAKATMFISGLTVSNAYSMSINDMPVNCSGNLRHLIVEACIARNMLDTSAYLWPGYVTLANQLPRSVPSQTLGWLSLMNGSPLTPSMINILVSTPASSLPEIEKIYEIAVSGSDDEKISAAAILCGASLVRGWNIQVPLLAGALMPICEAFGSAVPEVSWALPTGEELSCHAVFSNAFTLLLRLWRFDHPPIDHVMGDVPPVGSHLSPEYLLLVRNSLLASPGTSTRRQLRRRRYSKILSLSVEPIFMDSFPKLKLWYRQHLECIASTFSGLVHGTPVHQIVDALLNLMFRRINRGVQPSTSTNSGSSLSSGPGAEDAQARLKIPAWDILEATPFALDAALTACAHGRLSPRELATGLKDLADFLPASLATIVSYLSAEVTRGIWKPASMNGTDWPSPAVNLSSVEQQIKKILAATGVDVPSLSVGGTSLATLPLPLAALVSLTITYKLDKMSERFLTLVGPALNALAAGCPWPCMPIITSLWAQKVKRWSDYLVFSASRTVFHHNSDAVVQLLKSCFASTLGLSPPHISSNGGVGALLGHGFGSHLSGGISAVAPGILYLRVHRSVRDVMFMTEEILSLLMHSVRDIASSAWTRGAMEKLKKRKYGMRYGKVSLAAAMTRVKLAASLGSSLVWISGGLNLVQSLINETLPSWFISVHGLEQEGGDSGGLVARLRGYALAYFALFCGTFAWGVDSESASSKKRPTVLKAHLEFLASALEGKISLGCDWATAWAYASGFVCLMVACTPKWVPEVDVDILKRVSKGLRQWNEEELAVALLGLGGVGTMGAAAELVIEIGL
ncbi:PREDICTED: mediator of RNA polymerase II transcription subunit 33B-like isoform X1 [Populus euphratica]|uniref:Mediator of RNA polymerase II transcription subunit 33B-like isoform X1 n=1 Tax=Populus euphratica TaxID=75702 RepID=A0AAJ6TB74_POPEU|nr:PREDICTED: mediator of RNA polymerase II transcription subunit 33B-like isoform X1 [Populus euphratica]